MKTKAIPDHVLAMLGDLTVEGSVAKRHPADLDRADYLALNKVLTALGGKWKGGRVQGHVFAEHVDVAQLLDACMTTGCYVDPKAHDFFETPAPLASELAERAGVEPGELVLEPSAGRGAIVKAIVSRGARVDCCEILPENVAAIVAETSPAVVYSGRDFLSLKPQPVYDRVVMNPPFSGSAGPDHVLHAFEFLRPGGRLVSVLGAGVTFRTDRKHVAFREFIASHGGTIEPLPDGSFKASGTNVRTVVVTVERDG